MAMPEATPALIERVEPNMVIEHTCAQAARGGFGQARAFLAEQQHAAPRQLHRLQRHRTREVVDADDGQPVGLGAVGPCPQVVDRRVVDHVLVALGHHRAPPVPAAPPDDVDGATPGRRWRCARPSRCSGRDSSSRPPRGTGAGAGRGRRRWRPPASSGSGPPRCAGRPPRAARDRGGDRRATAAGGARPRSDRSSPRIGRHGACPAGNAGDGPQPPAPVVVSPFAVPPSPAASPSSARICDSRAWASLFIDACSTSSMRDSTDDSVSSDIPLARA